MDIVGITLDGELKGYVTIKSLKINKWIDPKDMSLDVIFRLTIEHKYKEEGFKKLEQLYVYFREKDLEDIIIEPQIIEMERKRLKKSLNDKSEERKLQEKISPLEGYTYPILTRKVVKEDDGEKKRIKVKFEDYEVSEKTKKRIIMFPLRFKRSIVSSDSIEHITSETPWYYDCVIEPYMVQTLKWSKNEFMPLLEMLSVWLQIPKELYGSLSAVNIQPVGHFEQIFLLEEEMAKRFQNAGQPLAKENVLCINWSFSDIGISSPPEEIEVTCKLRRFEVEEYFIKRFEENREDSILILRELLYLCKVQTIDFNHIISGISDKTLKRILEIFDTMIFRKNSKPMKENLDSLLPLLEYFKYLPFGEELFDRYDALNALLNCKKSEEFFSKQISSRLERIQESKDVIDPDYIEFMRDIGNLVGLTKKFNLYTMDEDNPRYKSEVLSGIEKVDNTWSGRLINPDKHIFYKILINWKNIIEKEYEEQVPTPELEATIKTKRLAFGDKVGIVLSVENIGKGEAQDVQAMLFDTENYDVVMGESEIKTHLARREFFEPGLEINPRNTGKIDVSFEIYYKDRVGRGFKKQFRDNIEVIKKDIPFQKIENPYIIGDIVREKKMFYGRKEIITSIIDNFKGRYQENPIFLYGQRRTGKTSLLHQLKRILRDEFAPVIFDMSKAFGKKSFYQDLMGEIKKELQITDIEFPSINHDPFVEFMNGFYGGIKQKLNGRKMILMIDEYQKIDKYITDGCYDDNVIDFLNALSQDGEIRIILAGFLQPDELKSKKWVKLMRLFITMNVSFLRREDAIGLICEPVKGQIEYDDGAIEKIISLSACHPYFVQLICHTMVEHHNYNQITLMGYESVTDHLFDYLEKGNNVFLDIISDQTREIESKILFYMHDFMEKKKAASVHRSDIEWNVLEHDKSIGRAEIEKALSELEKKEIIKKAAGHTEYYEFTVDLYRYWAKWNISHR